MDPLEGLKRSLEASQVIRYGDYDYFIHPISDGIPALEPKLLGDVAAAIADMVDPHFDKILTVEAMGIPIGTALSLKLGKPLTIVRKKRYGLEGEIKIAFRTGYSSNVLHVNGIRKGDRILFIDDVLSTGGTIRSVVTALRQAGGELCDCVVIIEKGRNRQKLEKELGIKIRSLVKVDIKSGKVVAR